MRFVLFAVLAACGAPNVDVTQNAIESPLVTPTTENTVVEDPPVDLTEWGLTQRCELIEQLAVHHIRLMEWSQIEKFIDAGRIRYVVSSLPDTMVPIIGVDEACAEREVVLSLKRQKITVFFAGPAIKLDTPYLALALQNSAHRGDAQFFQFEWKMNSTLWSIPNPQKSGIVTVSGPVVIGVPAPTVRIEILHSAKSKMEVISHGMSF